MNALNFNFFEKIPVIMQEMKLLQHKGNERMQFQEDEILALILSNQIDDVRRNVIDLTQQFKIIVALGMAIDALTKIEKLKEKTLKLYNLFKGLPQDIDNLALKLFTDKEKCLLVSFLYLCTFIKTHKSITQFSEEVQEFVDKTIENQTAYIAESIVAQLKKLNLENKYTKLLSDKLVIDCQLLNPQYTSQKLSQQYQFTPFKLKAALKSTVKKSLKVSDVKQSKSSKKGKPIKLQQSNLLNILDKQKNSDDSETEKVNPEDVFYKKKESVFEDLQKFKQQQAIVLGDYQANSKKGRSQRKVKQDSFDSELIDKFSLNYLKAYLTNDIPEINYKQQQQELKKLIFDI